MNLIIDYHRNLMKFLRDKIAHVFVLLVLVLAVNHLIFSFLLANRDTAKADDFIGLAAIGSNIYPRANLQYLANLKLPADLTNIQFSLIDKTKSQIYLASNKSENKGSVLAKFDLASWQRQGDLELDDYLMISGVLDDSNGYLYLGVKKIMANGVEYKVVKIDFNKMAVIEAVSLNPEDNGAINHPVLDTLNNSLYFISSDVSGTNLLKINIQPGKFQRLGGLRLDNATDQLGFVHSLALQAQKDGGLLYLSNQQKIDKVDLAQFKYVGSLKDPDYGIYKLLGIDQDLGYLFYYNKYNYKYSQIRRVNLANFSLDYKILNLNTTDDCLAMAVGYQNITRHTGYISTLENILEPEANEKNETSIFHSSVATAAQHKIIKINLTNFTKENILNLSLANSQFNTLMADPVSGYLYLLSKGSPDYLTKIDIALDREFKEIAKYKISAGQKGFTAGVIDPGLGFAYFAVTQDETEPRKIIKIDLVTLTKIAEIDLAVTEKEIVAAVADIYNHLAYFVTESGTVIKIDLNKFEKIGSIALGASKVSGAAIDFDRRLAYFSTNTTPAKLFKVSIEPDSLKLMASLTTSLVGNSSLLVDSKTNRAYLADYDSRMGHISKINLDDFSLEKTISTGKHLLYKTAFFDPARKFAFFVTSSDEIARIDLKTFEYVNSFTPPLEFRDIGTVISDSSYNNYVYYFANKGIYSRLIKLAFTLKDFEVKEFIDLPYQNEPIKTILIDEAKAEMYLGAASSNLLQKVSYSPLKGKIKAVKIISKKNGLNINRLEFYSHQASGNLRFAIYDAKKNLLWQSKAMTNTVNNGWLKIEITDRSRKYLASLKPGEYWLAFQTDTVDNIASFSPGLYGSGWELPCKFGLFPKTISGENITAENWSIYGIKK